MVTSGKLNYGSNRNKQKYHGIVNGLMWPWKWSQGGQKDKGKDRLGTTGDHSLQLKISHCLSICDVLKYWCNHL